MTSDKVSGVGAMLLAGLGLAFGPVPAARGFDFVEAKTEVDVVDPSTERSPVQMECRAELRGEVPDLVHADVVATWQQAGGVSPIPFLVTIPAGCFVASEAGFHVEDFRACGVAIDFDRRLLPLVDFEARLLRRSDGTSRFDLGALFGGPPDDGTPVLLGALGGAVVELVLGTEGSRSVPLGVETVSGVEPTPF